MQVRISNSFAWEEAWGRIHESCDACPSLSPAVAAARWEKRQHRGAELCVVGFEHDGVLVAVLPLARHEGHLCGLSDAVANTSVLARGEDGPLVTPGCEQAVGSQLVVALERIPGWKRFRLGRIGASDPIGALLRVSLSAAGPCAFDVRGGVRFVSLANYIQTSEPAHFTQPDDMGDELLTTLKRRAHGDDLRAACTALSSTARVEIGWRGQRSAPTAICAIAMTKRFAYVLDSWGVDDEERALHRTAMRCAAHAGVEEYVFWCRFPDGLIECERPVRSITVERRSPEARMRSAAGMARNLFASFRER